MRTREQCLDKAEYCERLARDASSPASRQLLLDAAQHWRSLAGPLPPEAPTTADEPVPISELDDPILVQMLSEVGALIR